jgi:hypothetical protein
MQYANRRFSETRYGFSIAHVYSDEMVMAEWVFCSIWICPH